jgi:D-serine deaminase-like pyridoxal phosphate-dependent protein
VDDPDAQLRRLEAATAHLDAPFALVDLDAFDANAADMARRAAPKPIRLASKSVRARALVTRALARDGFAGVLAFTLGEALWLVRHGVSDDVVVGYPTADRASLRMLAANEQAAARIVLMVDDAAQLDLVDAACGRDRPALQVCLDLDASWRPARGLLHVGARRSPLHAPARAAALASEIVGRPGFRLVGLMAYEAQIAGVGDQPPGRRLMGAALRAMQRRSGAELAQRRAAAVAAVRAVAPLRFVNGGGTGSLERTAREAAVTELAAGSGLFAPTLFDAYGAFELRPSALFALPVVRRPGPRSMATVLGGGYPASGAAGADRLPAPHLPAGLRLDRREGAGEVQTPVLGDAAAVLRAGDRVWFRHAKAGELCERFATLHLLAGDTLSGEVPTYRGEGRTFL